MMTYHGVRKQDDVEVWIQTSTGQQRKLSPRFDIRKHSPTGFEWGYNGSGPAQLALAICCDVLRDVEKAKSVYMEFKDRVVTTWQAEWCISAADVLEWSRIALAMSEQRKWEADGGICSICRGRMWLHMVSDARGNEIQRCDECHPQEWLDSDAKKKHDKECKDCHWCKGGDPGKVKGDSNG